MTKNPKKNNLSIYFLNIKYFCMDLTNKFVKFQMILAYIS